MLGFQISLLLLLPSLHFLLAAPISVLHDQDSGLISSKNALRRQFQAAPLATHGLKLQKRESVRLAVGVLKNSASATRAGQLMRNGFKLVEYAGLPKDGWVTAKGVFAEEKKLEEVLGSALTSHNLVADTKRAERAVSQIAAEDRELKVGGKAVVQGTSQSSHASPEAKI